MQGAYYFSAGKFYGKVLLKSLLNIPGVCLYFKLIDFGDYFFKEKYLFHSLCVFNVSPRLE